MLARPEEKYIQVTFIVLQNNMKLHSARFQLRFQIAAICKFAIFKLELIYTQILCDTEIEIHYFYYQNMLHSLSKVIPMFLDKTLTFLLKK